MLYNNMMFKQTFGNDAFKAAKASGYNMDQRNEMLREKVVNEAFDAAYKPLGKNGQRDNNIDKGHFFKEVFPVCSSSGADRTSHNARHR